MCNSELCVKDKIVMFDSRSESKQSPLYNLSSSGSATCKTENQYTIHQSSLC